jgi:hypothetical protein
VNNETALIAQTQELESLRPVSLKDGMAFLPVEKQKIALEEYDTRRSFFLKWLFSHLKEGLHYGFPPGCEVKFDDNGNMIQWNGKSQSFTKVLDSQWIAKPCLYKAGAKFIIDLLKLKAEYSNDVVAWEMMGKPSGVMVRNCKLIDQATGQIIGTGTGAFKVEQKGMDANGAIKMADKRADIAAVLNGVPAIGELFTQDAEEKLAERRKGNVKGRQQVLLQKVTDLLIDSKSKWPNDPSDWLKIAIASVLGPNARLTSHGAIEEFEKALDAKKIDLDTGKLKI